MHYHHHTNLNQTATAVELQNKNGITIIIIIILFAQKQYSMPINATCKFTISTCSPRLTNVDTHFTDNNNTPIH